MSYTLEEAKTAEKEALRETLGGGSDIGTGNPLSVGGSAPLNGFSHTQWYGGNLNDILTGRYAPPAPAAQLPQIDIDDYKDPLYPLVTPLAVGGTLYLYSRQFFDYPELFSRTVLADRTGLPLNSLAAFEFEGIAGAHSLRAGYWVRNIAGLTTVYGVYTDQAGMGEGNGVDLAAYLPVDYMTASHLYSCKLNKGIVEYRIDNELVLAVIYATDSVFYTLAGPPYDIRVVPRGYNPLSAQFHLHLEDTNPFFISGFSNGVPLPPRVFPLYNTGTNTSWTALATSGNLQTSHPVPVFGYTTKTLYFMATGAGTLTVQIYAGGGWRTIATPAVAANTLVVYALASETPIVQCLYDPSNGDTITLAEWCLS